MIAGRIFMVKRQDNLIEFKLGANEAIISVTAGEMIVKSVKVNHSDILCSRKQCFQRTEKLGETYFCSGKHVLITIVVFCVLLIYALLCNFIGIIMI